MKRSSTLLACALCTRSKSERGILALCNVRQPLSSSVRIVCSAKYLTTSYSDSDNKSLGLGKTISSIVVRP